MPAERIVMVPLATGQWLALEPDVFRQALAQGSQLAGTVERAAAAAPDEQLLNAGELARALSLPKSCVYEKARTGEFPSVRVGKHVRFRRSAVLAALNRTAPQAVSRA